VCVRGEPAARGDATRPHQAVTAPISPPRVDRVGAEDLPAFVSNGVIGMRVLELPLVPGVVIVSGLAGIHPVVDVEAAARAPYPLAGDIGINGVWLREAQYLASFTDQAYDFATGELTTRFRMKVDEITADVEVLTLCSRTQPTVVAQEVAVTLDAPADLTLRATVDPTDVQGRWLRRDTTTPGEPHAAVDGSMAWATLGDIGTVGIAYSTSFVGAGPAERSLVDSGRDTPLSTQYSLRARRGRRVRLHQIASLVPDAIHAQPDREAVRLAARAADEGFEELRRQNAAAWTDIWRGRINLVGAERRWQELADAALFYLVSSTHRASPASTSIFGLAQWTDYHYYYGHVMWDIEAFCVPPLSVLQPAAARSLLDFRARTLESARVNARLHDRDGVQFPWEAGMGSGQEAAPGAGKASWHEDHVSIDVAWAALQFAAVTGDEGYLRAAVWPIVEGVAEWLVSRAVVTDRGYEIRRAMGIAERELESDNEAYTNMGARLVLRGAIELAHRLGAPVREAWHDLLGGLVLPMDSAKRTVISHDGWQSNETKGATPGPLAGLFPLGERLSPAVERATIQRYLRLADGYIGSPMLSPFYGVWATRIGDRARALRLLDEGYGQLIGPRFLQTLEMRPDREPEKPNAGPFFANLGGFLSSLLFGFPGITLSLGPPTTWASRPVVLPEGWEAIEVERLWVRGRPARLVARHGAPAAEVTLQT
jgi:trehalose/maltose hydrolase-like predicted phosphorylase